MIPMHSKQEFDRRHSDPREAAMVMYGSQRLHYPVSNYPMWQYNPGRYVPQTMMMSMSMPAFAQQQQEALMAMSVGRSSLSSPHRPFMSTISKVPNSPASPPVLSPPQAAVASTNAAPASGVDKQRDIEAAEVLLGLTSKDGGDEKEASNAQKEQAPSMHKSAAASVGHVTDTESSTGTLSRTNSPLLNHHRRNHETSSTSSVPTVDASGTWYNGSVSLSLPEDDDVLSPLHCFMRKYCVEAFSATAQDVATPRYGKSHGFKVEVGQVGIRCLYCKNLPAGKRPERAVCYPSSLRNIYHSIETWQRRHSQVCTHISPWVRKSMVELMESSKTRAGGRRKYWEDSAKRLGMMDTPRGVRFMRPPGDLGPVAEAVVSAEGPFSNNEGGKLIVREDDKDLVTDYLYLLMEQMQTCYFTEEDRSGGRSKIKDISINFPGYECRHCHGRAGFGRYFPSSVSALSLANSDRNVFNHLQKCRRCPQQIKNELIRLSKAHAQSKNRRGLRKLFFNRIWERMHGHATKSSSTKHPVMSTASIYHC